MRRSIAWLAAASLALGLAACNGGSEPEATSSATEATPTGPPPQPEGEHGVTWEIQNWEDYAEDEAVLTWKKFNEAVAGSSNSGDLVPAARELSTKEALRPYVRSLEYAWDNGYVVEDVAIVRIAESSETEDGARLVACTWSPSVVLREDDTTDDELKQQWSKQVASLTDESGSYVIDEVTFDGTCKGGPPT